MWMQKGRDLETWLQMSPFILIWLTKTSTKWFQKSFVLKTHYQKLLQHHVSIVLANQTQLILLKISQNYDFQDIILLLEVKLNGKLPRVKLTKWTWLTLFIVLVPPLQSSPRFMQTNPYKTHFESLRQPDSQHKGSSGTSYGRSNPISRLKCIPILYMLWFGGKDKFFDHTKQFFAIIKIPLSTGFPYKDLYS